MRYSEEPIWDELYKTVFMNNASWAQKIGEQYTASLRHCQDNTSHQCPVQDKRTQRSRKLSQKLADRAIQFDHPELFWYGEDMSASDIDRYQHEIDAIAEQFKEQADGMSDRDAVYFCAEFISERISYKTDSRLGTTICALVTGFGNCQAYAESMKYLLGIVGIPCAIIWGFCNNGGIGDVLKSVIRNGLMTHAWNAVLIDEEICYIDVTSSVPMRFRSNAKCNPGDADNDDKTRHVCLYACQSLQSMKRRGYHPFFDIGDGTDKFTRIRGYADASNSDIADMFADACHMADMTGTGLFGFFINGDDEYQQVHDIAGALLFAYAETYNVRITSGSIGNESIVHVVVTKRHWASCYHSYHIPIPMPDCDDDVNNVAKTICTDIISIGKDPSISRQEHIRFSSKEELNEFCDTLSDDTKHDDRGILPSFSSTDGTFTMSFKAHADTLSVDFQIRPSHHASITDNDGRFEAHTNSDGKFEVRAMKVR